MFPNPLAARSNWGGESGANADLRIQSVTNQGPVTWTLLSYDTAENLLTAKKQNQLKSFRIKMDILKFFMIILPFASTMTLPEQKEFDNSIF